MNFTYAAFGLLLHSNLPIPELTSVRTVVDPLLLGPSNDCAVAIHMNATPRIDPAIPTQPEELSYASSYKDDGGNPTLKIWKATGSHLLRLAYYDGMQFWLDREGREIWATWPSNLAIEDAAAYLLGPVLGLVLRLGA